MEIGSFLFSQKGKWLFLLSLMVFSTFGCQNLRTRSDIQDEEKKSDGLSGPVVLPKYEIPTATPTPITALPQTNVSPIPAMPKIGFILGPGGARAYAHIGVLQNLSRLKIPAHAVVGVEWGAPIAALYASRGQVYDVEWQMFKLKDDVLGKKSLIGGREKENEVAVLGPFFQSAFAGQKVEGFKYPFACPAFNLLKNQVYMMSRGLLENLLPYCVPYSPSFRPFNRNVSGIREIKMAADYLRSQGANYIVLVNVLGTRKQLVKDPESVDGVIWAEIANEYGRLHAGIDAVIPVELDSYLVTDFDKRREIMQKGSEASQKSIDTWSRRLGF